MASLARIRVHPIKALDPEELDRVRISPVGGLTGDRTYAIRDPAGEYVNGKLTDAVHHLSTDVDLDAGSVTIGVRGAGGASSFHLDRDRDALAAWLSAYFGFDVGIESAPGGELSDSSVLDDRASGATVVSTGTLETVASWFPDVDVESVRSRFRSNLEVDGVPPFWEDRLVGDGGERFEIGGVVFDAVKPVYRCVVPTRDPDTGERTEGFRERFIEKRAETFPEWADPAAFDHLYALTTLATPDDSSRGETVAVGDDVELVG